MCVSLFITFELHHLLSQVWRTFGEENSWAWQKTEGCYCVGRSSYCFGITSYGDTILEEVEGFSPFMVSPPKICLSQWCAYVIVVLVILSVKRSYYNASLNVEKLTISMDMKAREGIQDVHFLPFNLPDKRTSLTYIDNEGKLHRSSKGAPKQVLFYECLTLFIRLGNGMCCLESSQKLIFHF